MVSLGLRAEEGEDGKMKVAFERVRAVRKRMGKPRRVWL